MCSPASKSQLAGLGIKVVAFMSLLVAVVEEFDGDYLSVFLGNSDAGWTTDGVLADWKARKH